MIFEKRREGHTYLVKMMNLLPKYNCTDNSSKRRRNFSKKSVYFNDSTELYQQIQGFPHSYKLEVLVLLWKWSSYYSKARAAPHFHILGNRKITRGVSNLPASKHNSWSKTGFSVCFVLYNLAPRIYNNHQILTLN